MQIRQSSAPLIMAAAVVVIASAILVLRPAVRLDSVAPAVIDLPEPDQSTPTASIGVTQVLLADDLRAAVRRFWADAATAPLSVREVRALVDQSCRVPQLLRMDGRDGPDWRRDRFVDELNRRCSGWSVPSMFVADASWDILIDEPPSTLTPAQALAELRAADDAPSLRRSWWVAYQLDALPQEQIFSDQRRLLPAEALQMIDVVIDWRQCARFAACGPDSLLTLRVCALHGCRGDEDLLGAWHAALSPREFESALAISRWLPLWSADD